MMTRLMALSAILCSNIFFTSAQTGGNGDFFELQKKVYQLAVKNYDMQAATQAMYQMMALRPAQSDLKDSLAMLYFTQERYPQAYLVGEEILQSNPANPAIRELVAISKQNLGMLKESLADYEKLYEQNKQMYYLYQIATLQYQLKRYGECVASLDYILTQKDADEQKVSIRVQSGMQEVPMKAAALNVKGICAIELNQKEAAITNFKKALEIYPEFVLAKGNLENLEKAPQPAAAPAAAEPKPGKKGK